MLLSSISRLQRSTLSLAIRRRPCLTTIWAFLLAMVVLGVLAPGCDQPFDPRAPLQEQMVMFSILSNDRDQQFVLVNRNYMPPGYDPRDFTENTFVSDAQVTISGPAGTFVLQDTSFARADTSRYTFPIQAYYVPRFTPTSEATYEVVAQSPTLATALGVTTIPGKAYLTMYSSSQAILRLPTHFPQDALVEVLINSQGTARGYVCRMYVYYDVLKNGQWVEERTEIPVSSISGAYSVNGARYPTITRRPEGGALTVFFRNGFYRAVVDDITYYKYPVGGLIYKWVVITFLQVDQNLYEYYNAIHQYRDPLTVRLDEPTYSTIQGGVGMVGSYGLDSLTYILPGDFYGNH